MISEKTSSKINWCLIISCIILGTFLIFNNLFGNEVFTIISSILVLTLDYDTAKLFIKKEGLKDVEDNSLKNKVTEHIKWYKLLFQTTILATQLAQLIIELFWGKDFIYDTEKNIILLKAVWKGGAEVVSTVVIWFIAMCIFNVISQKIFKEVIETNSNSQTT